MATNPTPAVPHLTTALNGPLQQIETQLLEQQPQIEAWLRQQWRLTPAPFYGSVDLRNAGFKLAPVDTNLFPAGFNNLNPDFLPLCIHAVQTAIERLCPTAADVVLVPERHTRNTFYLENVAALQEIITKAGFRVRIGSIAEEITEATTLALPSGRDLVLEPLQRTGRRVHIGDYQPCLVLLNNDLSGGRPEILEGLDQPVTPPPGIGWSNRSKSGHFGHYRNVATEFCELIGIDPWLIDPLFRNCGKIDFKKREGEDCLSRNVSALLADIRAKYEEYGIDREPFVIIKADSGTYGMGIMSVSSVEEIHQLNRKQRNKMASAKEGLAVSRVLIQEGVYTYETWGEQFASAEPVVYMIDHFVVGGFYRVHQARSATENLNAPGMQFQSLAFAGSCTNPDLHQAPDAQPNRFYAYGVIARLALLAAAREIAELK
ncbi:glutamate--cysteine ligase [Alkalilimnicola sp. S0819]|uniref:glutamate--cysteine ligase n=1 Tax=Alkalilimnicola sp. S0819 TaxID=2613922 RepID=UPI0012629E42|nr:glutamate--cysteine ligase [Alkalilimnicola sp. S0819]KAB7624471.1 glutamate--cysteine ligase [Alkalilimnicola sp. S0819]MPQ16307.1 glutamate--cysteine ligase [Alkalilimnicola sp. S0819]